MTDQESSPVETEKLPSIPRDDHSYANFQSVDPSVSDDENACCSQDTRSDSEKERDLLTPHLNASGY